MFYAIFNIKKKYYCKVPIILYSLVLIFDLKHIKCGGGLRGRGVIFFLHFMLFPTSLEKIILGIKN